MAAAQLFAENIRCRLHPTSVGIPLWLTRVVASLGSLRSLVADWETAIDLPTLRYFVDDAFELSLQLAGGKFLNMGKFVEPSSLAGTSALLQASRAEFETIRMELKCVVGPRAAQIVCMSVEDGLFDDRKSSACEEFLKEIQDKLGLLILDDIAECIRAIRERVIEVQCEMSTLPLGSPWSDEIVGDLEALN
eukprot:s625_g20.t1